MRVRTQRNNILIPAKYEKDISSVLVYGDDDKVLFAVTYTPAGTYKFTHVGQPEFRQEIKQITGVDLEQVNLHVLDLKNSNG